MSGPVEEVDIPYMGKMTREFLHERDSEKPRPLRLPSSSIPV